MAKRKITVWHHMPGPKPEAHTEFSRWMIRQGLSSARLAAEIVFDRTHVQLVREGKRPVSRKFSLAVRAKWQDAPLPKQGWLEVSAEPLPVYPGDLPRKPRLLRRRLLSEAAPLLRGPIPKARRQQG